MYPKLPKTVRCQCHGLMKKMSKTNFFSSNVIFLTYDWFFTLLFNNKPNTYSSIRLCKRIQNIFILSSFFFHGETKTGYVLGTGYTSGAGQVYTKLN